MADTLLAGAPDTGFVHRQVEPHGVSEERLRPGAALDDEGAAQLLRVLRDEDGGAVEQIQRVLRSPHFEVGPLARAHEAPITAFQRHVLEHLG